MPKPHTTPGSENLDRRLVSIEQILPTLVTKEDLQLAVAPLATGDFVRAEGIETRRHFDVVAESLRADIQMLEAKRSRR